MASAVSAIFILDLKGKVLISRNYRGDIPMSAVEKFLPLVLEAEEDSQAPAPCFTDDGINYLYIRHNNLFCKCASSQEKKQLLGSSSPHNAVVMMGHH